MKKTIILIILFALVFPAFAQGALEIVEEKGLVGAYKSLIGYKEGVLVPESEENEKAAAVIKVPVREETYSVVDDEEREEEIEEPEKEISFPSSDVIDAGFTNVTDYFSDLPEDEVYTTFFSHNGIKLAGAFTKNKAVVVIPRGISRESVSSFTSYLTQSCPEFSDATFSSEMDKIVITYPEKTMNGVIAICDVLSSEVSNSIDTIALRRTQSSSALLTEKKESTLEDTEVIKIGVENADEKYGATSDDSVSIPLGLENETGAFVLFDDVVAALAGEGEEVYEIDFSHNGIKTRCAFTTNKAVLLIPRGMTGASIDKFAAYLLENYSEFREVYFTVEFDRMILSYPDKSMDEIVAFSELLLGQAERFINSIALSRTQSSSALLTEKKESTLEDTEVIKIEVENADEKYEATSDDSVSIPLGLENETGAFVLFDDVVAALAGEGEEVYEIDFSHNGIKTRCAFTTNKAVLLIPRGMTGASIDKFAAYLLENYSEFREVYFTVEFDRMILSYPDKSMDEIVAFSELLLGQAERFINSIALSRTQSTVADVVAVSDDLDVIEESVVSSVSQPVTEEKKNSIFTYSAGFDVGLQGLFTSDSDEAKFFPTIGGDIRLYAWKFIFVEGGADMMIYKNSNKLIINGTLKAVGGLSLRGSNFGVVAYGGAMYVFASENSVFNDGFSVIYGVGLEFDFVEHVSLKAAYEHYDDKNLYNVSIGYRF